MSDVSQGQGWWLASDGKWYPPESQQTLTAPAPSVTIPQTVNIFCWNCGNGVSPHAVACPRCGVAPRSASTPDAKSRVVAGLLQLFLGSFGAGRFYLGHTGLAIAQVLCFWVVGLVTLGIGMALTAIWLVIDAIYIFASSSIRDAKGRPLT